VIGYSPMGGDDRHCEWRDQVEHLKEDLGYAAQALDTAKEIIAKQAETIRLKDEALAKQGEQLSQIQATLDKLQRHVFGKRSGGFRRFSRPE
jgi:transposase